MKTKGKYIIVCYDVPEDKRRLKISNILEDYGERVQYSVFECLIDEEHLKEMKSRIMQEMKPEEDKVNIYILCNQCRKNSIYLGKQEILNQFPEVYII